MQLADLVLAARLTVSGQVGPDDNAHPALQQLIQVGTSAGEARAKAVVAFNPATFQFRSAYGPPADGFEPWLVKLDGVSPTGMDGHGDRLGESAPYGRIEYAYNLMARPGGLRDDPLPAAGRGSPLSLHDPALRPLRRRAAPQAEDVFGASCLTPNTAPTIRHLAQLNPTTLAVVHGSSYAGDGSSALRALAEDYDRRLSGGSPRAPVRPGPSRPPHSPDPGTACPST